MIRMMLLAGAATGLMLAAGNPAQATLTLSSGLVGGSGDVDNVVFGPCGLSGTSGLTVKDA